MMGLGELIGGKLYQFLYTILIIIEIYSYIVI